jgi:hypothetical protein
MQTQQACPICSATLSPHEARKGFLCSRAECRWKYRLLTPSQLCTVCTRPLSARMGKSPVCERVECNREFFVDRIARDKEAKQQTLERQVGVWLGDAMQEYVRHSDVMDAPDIASFRITSIPSNAAVECELPGERRTVFRERLALATAEAFVRAEEVAHETIKPFMTVAIPPQSGEMSAVMGTACGRCRGNCCRMGSDHAFITAGTIYAYIVDHPGRSREEVQDDYLAYLPERTLDPGCVYQREAGCALPRTMRSDTCNRFFCAPLVDLERAQRHDAPVRAFFVQMANGEPEEGLLATASFVQLLRRASATSAPTPTENA